ncbi:GTP-binding protein [Candidatus Viridilinea mediisalina]|uniref:GTP-binding protein n=1 Tax=Candidatus Viridilinea mediisalina TaxID=2024553 RepID=A0A2A6RKR9_9CHLR|nr:ATP/GTP-binding protein [Candidatus Viridilinea mediisalina]PDW03714.1 GTP-binding protein [Candidatus Viridilinea mediisalina]
MQALKIVITGSYAAGKTQLIRTISDIDTISTDYEVTLDEERQLKRETTVALDFGTIAINDQVTLYLFGTPGQERFDFMWEHLTVGCLGYVVMVDSTRPGHFAETQRLMSRFIEITDAPFIVAANKQDDEAALPVSYVRRRLGVPLEIPVLPCVATDRPSVKGVLLGLLKHIATQNQMNQEQSA